MSIWNINVLWSKGRNSSADLWAFYSGRKPFLNILVNLCSLFTHLMPKDLLLLSQIVNYTWTNVANSEVDTSRAAEILHTLEERPIQSKGHLLSPNFLNRLHNVPTCAMEHWSSLLEAWERKEEKKQHCKAANMRYFSAGGGWKTHISMAEQRALAGFQHLAQWYLKRAAQHF